MNLVWTKEQPKEPGFYWFAYETNGQMDPWCDVYRVDYASFNRPSKGFVKGDLVRIGWTVEALPGGPNARWAGPIPQPSTETTE